MLDLILVGLVIFSVISSAKKDKEKQSSKKAKKIPSLLNEEGKENKKKAESQSRPKASKNKKRKKPEPLGQGHLGSDQVKLDSQKDLSKTPPKKPPVQESKSPAKVSQVHASKGLSDLARLDKRTIFMAHELLSPPKAYRHRKRY